MELNTPEYKTFQDDDSSGPVQMRRVHPVSDSFQRSSGASFGAPASPLQRELVRASHRNEAKRVRLLLALGADPNQHDGFYTPLGRASQSGSLDAMEVLLEAGADPNARDPYDRVPIDWAIQEAREEAVYRLHRAGARINVLSNQKSLMETALGAGDLRNPGRVALQNRVVHWLWAVGFDLKESGARAVDILAAARRCTPAIIAALRARPELAGAEI